MIICLKMQSTRLETLSIKCVPIFSTPKTVFLTPQDNNIFQNLYPCDYKQIGMLLFVVQRYCASG